MSCPCSSCLSAQRITVPARLIGIYLWSPSLSYADCGHKISHKADLWRCGPAVVTHLLPDGPKQGVMRRLIGQAPHGPVLTDRSKTRRPALCLSDEAQWGLRPCALCTRQIAFRRDSLT